MSYCAHDSDLSPTVPDFSPNFAANLRNTFAKLRPQLSMPSLRRYSGHRARLKLRMTNSILLKRDGPLRASYGLLWRSAGNRVCPLRLEVERLLPPTPTQVYMAPDMKVRIHTNLPGHCIHQSEQWRVLQLCLPIQNSARFGSLRPAASLGW